MNVAVALPLGSCTTVGPYSAILLKSLDARVAYR